MINPRLDLLTDFTFQRLARLLEPIVPPDDRAPIDLSIGSPQHQVPELLTEVLAAHGEAWNRYPPAAGTPEFRRAAVGWLARRFDLPADLIDPDCHLLPVAGTKEALFLIALVAVPEVKDGRRPAVLMPNPFYNVYLGAAVMAGAESVLLPATAASGHLPDLDMLTPDLLRRSAVLYLCSPANPQGAAADLAYLQRALELARAHDVLLIVDECYSEIYAHEPPAGALQVAAAAGGDLANLLVFHSLSKRSSAAGLRSGFVAGDPAIVRAFARLRGYAAAVQPLPVLAAATALWHDDAHVVANRDLYRQKFRLAEARLGPYFGPVSPDGGFFLWLDVGDGEATTVRLWQEAGLKVLPGAYLGRAGAEGHNPGQRYIRLALVHDLATTVDALDRLVAAISRR
jgi:aspartate/methionine/tyrosine aminotransferase